MGKRFEAFKEQTLTEMRKLQVNWITNQLHFIFVIAFILSNSIITNGQIAIPDASPVSQNFDGMGSNTALPSSWRMGEMTTTPTWAGGLTAVTQQASSGTPVTGGTYNWGTTGGSERAVGAMTSGSFDSPNNLMANYRNTGGSNITAITISYTAERYRQNIAAASIQFYYSLNGSSWTSVSAGDIGSSSFPTGTNTYYFGSPSPAIPVNFNITNLTLTPNSDFYIRWNINTTGSNSQGIGIDDVSVVATFEPTCTSPSSQAASFSASNVQYNQMQVNWTRGNGDNVLVVARLGSAVNLDPTNGMTYSANSIFGSGAQIGTGNYVIYNGAGTNVVLTNLTSSSTYYFAIYEYFNTGPCYNLAELTGNATTPATPSFYFRSKQSGNWTTVSTWESSLDNISWNNATSTPTSSDATITIQTGHSVTITSNISFDGTVIQSGATLQLSQGTSATLANGSGVDLDCFGTFLNSGTITWTGTMTVSGTYIHNNTSSSGNALDAATLSSGSTWIYRNSSSAVSASGRTFFNLYFESTSGTYSVSISGSNALTVNGDFIIGASVVLTNAMTGTNVFAGNFENNGTLTNSSGTQVYSFTGAGKTIGGTTATAFETLIIASSASITLGSNISILSGFTGTNNGILNCGTYSISGAGTFTLASGSTIITANANGMTNTVTTGVKNLSSGANYEFQGNSTGIFSTTPTANTVNNLTINSLVGDVSLGQTLTSTGTLSLLSGKLNLSGFTLTFSGTIAGIATWGSTFSNYIIATSGFLVRNNPGNTIFPVGTSSQYLPCRLSGAGVYNVNLASSLSPGLPQQSLALPTQWNITGSGSTVMDFQWPSDIFGSTAYLYKYSGTDWSTVAGPTSTNGTGPITVGFTGIPVTCCTGFTVGALGALPFELTKFDAIKQNSAVFITWQTASELNNDYFSIEKSSVGKTFREIGRVKGMGTSYETNDYSFSDENPANGLNYYRLKQVDFDGQFSYSNIVSVDFSIRSKTLVYPSTTNGSLTIETDVDWDEVGEIQIFNSVGNLQLQDKFENTQGKTELDVSFLPSGAYFLKLFRNNRFETIRFTKI